MKNVILHFFMLALVATTALTKRATTGPSVDEAKRRHTRRLGARRRWHMVRDMDFLVACGRLNAIQTFSPMAEARTARINRRPQAA